jgi:outer membrane receptor protein involved in Fe transport
VVVTANKRAQDIQSVPVSVTAVGANLIQRVQAQSLSDVSAYVPGLDVQSSGVDANRLVIRGLSTGPNDLSPSVGVYVDDAPFGSNSGFALGALFSPDVDPFDLDHIEVLRGPQGTLYGASTLGGLVKFVTTAPNANDYTGHIRVDYGREDASDAASYAARAGLNIPIVQDKVALRVSGFYSHADGDITDVRTGQTDLNATAKEGGRVDLMIKPADNLTVDLVAFFDRSDTPHLGVVTGNAVTLQPTYGQYAGYDYVDGFARSHYEVYEGNILYQFPDGITATSTTSYSNFAVKELADDTTVFQPALGPFLGPLLEFSGPVAPTTNKITEEFRLASPENHHFEWLAGLFYDHEDSDYLSGINSTYLFGATPPAFLAPTVEALANYETVNNIEHYVEYAGFADGTYYVTSNLDLSAGVRFSHNDQHLTNTGSGFLAEIGEIPTNLTATSSDNVWTESFDARWRYAAGSMLYARVARGYRPGGPNVTGTSFRPDTTWNYEVGDKTTALDGRLTADLSLFYIDWQDIQLNFFNGTVTVIGNAGNARSEGAEFEGTYTPITGLTFALNGAYTDAYISSLIPGAEGGAVVGNQLPFNSKWTGALRADYFFPVNGVIEPNIGASLRYKSAFGTTFPGDPGTRFYELPATTFVDLRVGVTFDARYALNLQVLNLANERKLTGAAEFLAVSAGAADAAGQPVDLTYSPGRSYGLSFTAKF